MRSPEKSPCLRFKACPGAAAERQSPPWTINEAAISPDGKTYVLANRKVLLVARYRDVATGNMLNTVEHSFQSYSVVSIEFSADSRHFVVGDRQEDGLPLPVIEVDTGKTISRVEGSGNLAIVRFVPGTDKLAGIGASAAPGKGAVNLFDWKSGKSLGSIEVDSSTSVLEVAPDGKTLIAGNLQRTFAQIIEIDTGKEIGAESTSTPSLKTLARFSPDGKLLAGARHGSGAITVWDMKTRDYHVTAAEPVRFFRVRFGPDSNSLAIPVLEWPLIDWRTGKVLDRLMESDNGRPSRATLSPNRQWFAKWEPKNRSISVVDTKSGEEFRSLNGHEQFASNLTFPKKRSTFSSSQLRQRLSASGTYQKNGNRKSLCLPLRRLTGVEQIALSNDGRIMAVGVKQGPETDSSSDIIIWDVDAKARLACFKDGPLLDLSPDGKWLAAFDGSNSKQPGDESAVHIWETATGRMIHVLPGHSSKFDHKSWTTCAFSPDSRWVVTGDASGKLRIWEVLSGQEVRLFIGHNSTVRAQFSPDGKLLVAASARCMLHLGRVQRLD